MQLGLAEKISHQLTFKIQVKATFHRIISAIFKPLSTQFSSKMMIPLQCRLFV